eukprot:7096527-Karenia_brevis.AAC.1
MLATPMEAIYGMLLRDVMPIPLMALTDGGRQGGSACAGWALRCPSPPHPQAGQGLPSLVFGFLSTPLPLVPIRSAPFPIRRPTRCRMLR